MSERFGALPLGELHAEGVCAYCGHRAPLEGVGQLGALRNALRDAMSFVDPDAAVDYPLWERALGASTDVLRPTVHPMTLAVAHVCVDTVACERRRYNSRRRI